MKKIGLTGGIGSGKTTASNYLKELGYKVLDADIAARELTEKGSPVLSEIASEFGEHVILPDGTLDRKALGAIIFGNEEKRIKLNALLHERIKDNIKQKMDILEKNGEEVVFVDAALLFEAEIEKMLDKVFLIDIPKEEQIKRIKKRDNLPEEEIIKRIESQLSREEQIRRSDYVIDNTSGKNDLKRKIDKLLSVILMLMMIFSFAACGNDNRYKGDMSNQLKNLVFARSDYINIPLRYYETLNPIVSKDEDVHYFNKLIYQGLFTLGNDLSAENALAADYEYLSDGLSVSIKLKKDIKWQNGKDFTANDVKASIDAYKAASANTEIGTLYEPYISKIDYAKVINKHTIVIKFKDIADAAVENLTFPIVYKSDAKIKVNEKKFVPMGTGPYKVESIDPNNAIILVKNPEYAGNQPTNMLSFNLMPNDYGISALFEGEILDMALQKDIDREAKFNKQYVNVVLFPSNEFDFLGFNFRNDILKNPNIRKAIIMAIDNNRIIESCYYNSATASDSIFPAGYLGLGVAKPVFQYNPDKAREILNEETDERPNFRLIYNGANLPCKLAASQIKVDLLSVGIDVTLTELTESGLKQALSSGSYDLVLSGFKTSATTDLRKLLKTENGIGYSNPVLDALLDKLQSSETPIKKKKVYEEVRKILETDLPYYCICYKSYGLVLGKNMSGNFNPKFYNIYNSCENYVREDNDKN